jgi:Skp family chaperone for outer membrane proteins
MTTEAAPSPSSGQKFWRGLGWLVKFILRLLFVLVIGVLLGAGIYWSASYGIAMVNQQIFQPIQNHTRQLADLESRYAQDYSRLNEQSQALQERIDALESQGDTTRETLDSLETRLMTTEAALSEMQIAIDAARENLSTLETQQTTFGPDITKLQSALTQLETVVDDLTETTASITSDVEALSVTVKDESPLVSVRTEVQVLRAMELLTRARLQLAQNNSGAATTEVQEARNVLLALSATVPADQQSALTAVVQRLDLGLANLPNAPRLAEDDFEIAWQLLTRELPTQSTAMPLLSPLAAPGITSTVALTATVPVTPTVTPTPKP